MGTSDVRRFLDKRVLLIVLVVASVTIVFSGVYTVFSKEFAPKSAIPTGAFQILPDAVTQRIEANQQGTLTSSDGKVIVRLPASAVTETLDVTFTPLQPWVWGANGMRLVNMFELKAEAVNRGRARVSQFNSDIDVTFNLSESYAENELRGKDLHSLALYHLNETTSKWELIPSTLSFDFNNRKPTLTSKARHFSVFGNQASPMISGPGTIMGFQTDPYSAVAVSTIPLEVPLGPSGFGPRLSLNYNSGSVDEMKNKRDVGSWVGIGWSFKLGSVTKNLETNEYFLDLNGSSYKLIKDTSAGTNIYRTEQESGFSITFANGDQWDLYDRNGTYYRFGGTANSVQHYKDVFTTPPPVSCSQNVYLYRFDLGLVRDINGNEMSVDYVRDIIGTDCYGDPKDIVSAYPLDITYGNNSNVSGSISRFNIHFNSSSDTWAASTGWVRNDNPSSYARVRDNKRLDSVEIKTDTDANGSYDSLVRKYSFVYNTTTASGALAGTVTLTSLQEYGADGTSSLPAMTFTYSDPTTYFYDPNKPIDPTANPGNPAEFAWPHLASVSSGYGGTVTYSYTAKPAADTSSQLIWVRAANTERATNPGIGATESTTYAYTGNPQYKVIDSNNRWLDEYRGFASARESDASGNYVDHYYYTVNPSHDSKDADKLMSKEYKTEWKNSSNVLLKQSLKTWNYSGCCVFLYTPPSTYGNSGFSHLVYLEQEDINVGSKTSRTRYTYDIPSSPYDSTDLGSKGGKLRENRDGDISISTDDSTVFWAYNQNLTANILDTIKQEKTYSGDKTSDDGTNLNAEAYFYFDGNNTCLTCAVSGANITRVQRASTVGAAYVNSYFTYDTRGNKLTEVDPNGNTRSWTYGSAATDFHNLPVTETYPAISGSSMSESATWDHAGGKILTWVDANTQTTGYEYDTFKRLIKTIKPGDTSGSPSITYNYNNWGTINSQNLETITKVEGSISLWSKQFFDGIGRVVQVQSKGESIGGTNYAMIGKTTSHNNRGMVDKEYISQKVDVTTLSGYKSPDTSWKYFQFAYDGIGRVTTTTKPDETTTSHSYSNWTDESTNERGYKKRHFTDAFGRLIKVEELDASHALYATTNYRYDILGNLTNVTDTASNQTSLIYDAQSRKTSMTDPDMGAWSYAYDANGNLTIQTDAKSQTIYFQYDALNRMTQKCTTSNCSNTVIASYAYDGTSGSNVGKGRRTSMSDTSSSTYKYDNRGRIIEETKTIDGSTYTTGYTYDGADRLTVVTYPGGETVTQAYNGSFADTLSSSASGNIVTGAVHNQLGATSQIDFNNGLRSIFQYHGIDSLDGGDASNYWGKLYKVRTYKTSDSSDKLLYKYWWDAAGNLTKRQDTVLSATEEFTYDAIDRITAASNLYTASYAYNAIGNITSADSVSYTYGTKPHAVTGYDGYTFAYDANGSMTTWVSAYSMTYDVENKMRGFSNSYFAYTYDGDGNRIKKESGLIERDTFGNAANGTSLTSHTADLRNTSWSASDSHWTIQSNKAAYDGTSDNQQAVMEASRADVTLEADVTTSATSNKTLGLVWRWSSSSNYYIAYLIPVDGLVKVSKVVSGSWTGLVQSNVSLSTSTTYKMKVIANGSSFKVYVNGTLYIDGSDSTFTTDTKHGIATNGSSGVSDMRWDNLQVTWIYSGTDQMTTTVYPNKYMEKNVTATPNQTTLYYFFNSQMVALKKGSTLEYLHADPLGSTSVTTDTSGGLTSRTRYKPFGEVLTTSGSETSGTLNTEHKFTGQRYDTATDLYFYNARYYDRRIRRFTQADILVPTLADPQDLNRYSYVTNNPLRFTDQSGNCKSCRSLARGVFAGLKANTVDGAKGIYDLAKDPGAIKTAISNPREVLNAMSDPYTSQGAAYGAGHGAVDVVSMVFPVGKIGKVAQAAKIASVAKAAKFAEVTVGRSVWKLGNFERGKVIEDALGRNLARNHPVIDKFDVRTGNITSIKSIDLGAASYQDIGVLTSKIRGYVKDVEFYVSDVTLLNKEVIQAEAIKRHGLLVAIPEGASISQIEALLGIQREAMGRGVILEIVVIK